MIVHCQVQVKCLSCYCHVILYILVCFLHAHTHTHTHTRTYTHTRTHTQVRIEPNYTSVMVAFMVIEGVARSLDPTLDIFVYAKPCILQRAKFAIKEQLKQTVRQKLPFCGTVVED